MNIFDVYVNGTLSAQLTVSNELYRLTPIMGGLPLGLAMEPVKDSGADAAKAYLSDDRKRLIVERFDVQEDGTRLGFEEVVTLMGRPSDAKYDGSYMEAFNLLSSQVSPKNKLSTRRDLFRSTVLNVALRNGDAHLKNYGLLYDVDRKDIKLAPLYDIVNTVVYTPHDTPALKFPDINKAWPDSKQLVEFGRSLGLKASVVKSIIDDVAEGVMKATHEMVETYGDHNEDYEVVEFLSKSWSEGVESIGGKISYTLDSPLNNPRF